MPSASPRVSLEAVTSARDPAIEAGQEELASRTGGAFLGVRGCPGGGAVHTAAFCAAAGPSAAGGRSLPLLAGSWGALPPGCAPGPESAEVGSESPPNAVTKKVFFNSTGVKRLYRNLVMVFVKVHLVL